MLVTEGVPTRRVVEIYIRYDFSGVDYVEKAQAQGIDPEMIDWARSHNNYTRLLEDYIAAHLDGIEAWTHVEMHGGEDIIDIHWDQRFPLNSREQEQVRLDVDLVVSDAHEHARFINYIEVLQE